MRKYTAEQGWSFIPERLNKYENQLNTYRGSLFNKVKQVFCVPFIHQVPQNSRIDIITDLPS